MSTEEKPKQLQITEDRFALYEDEQGAPVLTVDCQNGEIWMTQAEMAKLFGVTQQAISEHLQKVYDDGELDEVPTVRNNLTIQIEGERTVRRNINSYHLDAVISVGYRVNSRVGTRFRRWATQRLSEYAQTGVAIDGARFANGPSAEFDALVRKVRDIRTSEKHFYAKVRDIFAMSSDYVAGTDTAKEFFATVQNKFHYAILGATAAETIVTRIDTNDTALGLTNWKGKGITKTEAEIAKNYLTEIELKKMNLLVDQFLSFAELRALDGLPTTMAQWTQKVNDFLELNEKQILQGPGTVSRHQMLEKVAADFKVFNSPANRARVKALPKSDKG